MAYIGRDIEYGVLEKQTLTADSSTVAFDLTYISDANGLIVSVGGVVQEPNVAYTVLGSILTFTEAPTTGDTIYVVYLGQEMTVSSINPIDYIDYQVGTGDGSDTTPIATLNHSVSLAQDIMVTLNGVRQVPNTDYNVNGTTLTFTTAPANNNNILVYFLALVRTEGTVVSNSVTNAKIVSMNANKLTGSLPDGFYSSDFSAQYQDLSTLALHWASVDNKVAMNLTDDFIDHFQDSTGVDSANTVNALRRTDEYVESASELDTATNIVPSSNDWDYTFSNNEHPVAGNPLGDHSIGAYWKATSHNNGISSLITLDGDFEIEFTLAESNQSEFGVHAIDEDATRTTDSRVGMSSMTNSFWYRDESVTDFMIGGNTQSDTHTFADGSVVKIERVSGTIKVYDDDVVVHTYGTTYTGAMRFGAGDPGPAEADYDNFKITDTSKIQRDGQINEGIAGSDSCGDGISGQRYAGFQFTATRTGTVTSAKVVVATHTTSYNSTIDIYTDNAGSPGTIIGTASDSVSISSATTFTFPNISASVDKGGLYWAILNGASGSGSIALGKLTGNTLYGSGLSDTITAITDSANGPYPFEIAIDASAGEPTPDHDTLLLVQSDTTNGSTTFVDSSQNARTVTANGDAQHDTAQKKFGATSILLDGTGDFLTVPDHADFEFGSGPFTLDFWLYQNSAGSTDSPLSKAGTNAPWSEIPWMFYVQSGQIKFLFSNNGGSGFSLTSTSGVGTGAWIHIAVTRSANVFNLFVNGNLDATTTAAYPMLNNDTPIQIGRYSETYTAADWDGWVDEVRISKVARWDADFTPPTAPYLTSTKSTLSATGSLVSTASTADSTVSKASGVMLYKDDAGTNTIGTDLKAYFSADDGSNWTEAASYGSPTTFDGTTKVIPLGETTMSNTGTAVKLKGEWANQVATIPATGTTKVITPTGDANLSSSQVKFGNSSIYFDGTGDYISSADHADFDFSGDFTVELWMYNTESNSAGHLIGNVNHTTGAGGGWAIYCNGTGIIKFYDYGTTINTGQFNVGWTVNTWHHVCVTKESGTVKLWLDGQLQTSVAHTSTITSTNDLYIGFDGVTAGLTFDGYMDEIRISDTARYTANFTPSTTVFTSDANTKLLIHSDTTDDGVTFIDSSSNTHAITAAGDVKHSGLQSKIGSSSLVFDGSGDTLSIADHADWSFGTNDFTIEFWIKTSSTTDLANHGGGSTANSAFTMWLGGGGSNFGAIFCIGGSNVQFTHAAPNVADGSWHHLAVVRNGNVFTKYVDGTSNATFTNSGAINEASTPLVFGVGLSTLNGSGTNFNGYMDEIRISNTARYTANFTPSTTAFTSDANTKLLIHSDDASQIFTDSSSNTHTVTAVGDAKHQPPVKKIGSSSLVFDGSGDYLTLPKTADWQWTGDFTIETWFYLNSLDRGSFFSTSIEDSTTGGIGMLFEVSDNKITLQCRAGSGGNQLIQSAVLSTGQWYHVALVRSGTATGNTKIYLDGVALGTTRTSIGAMLFPASVVKIGKSRDDSATTFDGYMDEFRVSDSARYTANFTPSTTAFTTDANTQLLIHGDSTNPLTPAAGVGQGDRTSSITVTTNGTTTGSITNLVNGVASNDTSNACYFTPNNFTVSGKYIRFQFGSAQTLSTVKLYNQNNGAEHLGTWKWQGSNDGTTWTDISDSYILSNNTSPEITSLSLSGTINTTSYTYYQVLGVSGTGHSEWLQEIEFYEGDTPTDSSYAPEVIGKVAQLHGWAVNY